MNSPPRDHLVDSHSEDMATASMQNRTAPRQQPQQQPQQQNTQAHTPVAPTKYKPATPGQQSTPGAASSHHQHHQHHRDASNDRQENKYIPLIRTQLISVRPTWVRKNSSANTSTPAGSSSAGTPSTANNRATTPLNQSRTNSPAPSSTNAWAVKGEERAAHDQFTHLLYMLMVTPLSQHP